MNNHPSQDGNDFTKSELQAIAEAVTDCICGAEVDYWEGLYLKVKRMIDNHKEPCPSAHEFYEKLVCEQCGQVEDI